MQSLYFSSLRSALVAPPPHHAHLTTARLLASTSYPPLIHGSGTGNLLRSHARPASPMPNADPGLGARRGAQTLRPAFS